MRSKNLARINYLHFTQQKTSWLGQRAAECIPGSQRGQVKGFEKSMVSGQTVTVYFLLPAQVSPMLSFALHLCLFSLKASLLVYVSKPCSLLIHTQCHLFVLSFPLFIHYLSVTDLLFLSVYCGQWNCAQPKNVTQQVASKRSQKSGSLQSKVMF